MSHAEVGPHTLRDLESIVERGRQAIIEAAEALAEIRDRRLYREAGYANFASYCKARWGWSRSRAYQLIDFAQLRRQIPVENESEARRIAPAFRADSLEVVDAFKTLADAVGPRRAVKELAGRKRSPRLRESTARQESVSLSSVYAVVGLPHGQEPPRVEVAAARDIALIMRAQLERSLKFRKVLVCCCDVVSETDIQTKESLYHRSQRST